MTPFTRHAGVVAALDRANIDTDAIIPKQYLKSIRRTGFEAGLFSDWRYLDDGSENPQFELNQPHNRGASILLTRNNFGCGSSREHAVWAIAQYGFKVIIAPSAEASAGRIPAFADIFRNNSVRNGLLCIELDAATVDQLFQTVTQNPGITAAVDLEKQEIRLPADNQEAIKFNIEPGIKETLLAGLDEISTTLQYADKIADFEARHNDQCARPL